MKITLAWMCLVACSHPPGTAPAAATPATPAGPLSTLAAVDVFGSKHVSNAEILATAGFKTGSKVAFESPHFKSELDAATRRLTERYHFAFVEVSPISYFGESPEAGKVFITIDLVDADDPDRVTFAPAPAKDTADPAGLVAAWLDYDKVVWSLVQRGAHRPPFTCKGGMHCAFGFNHPDLEAREDVFIDQVPGHVAELVAVLHGERDRDRRAAAAFLLAYGADRTQIVDALVPSIDDPSALVRNNVLRVLVMIQQRADAVVVPLPAVIRAMRFPTTTDRNKAAYALVEIAKRATADDRAHIVHELGDVLVAMAAMQQPNNRDPAIEILKTISGEDHGTDAAAWRAWLDGWGRGK
jgi:hypothetical protein